MNVTLNANYGWFEDRAFDLEVGSLDETAKYVFTHGQCHSLALALHEATGWDIVGVGYGGTPDHVGVLSPRGRVLDITGYVSPDDWTDEVGGELSYHAADELYGAFDGDYRDPQVAAAKHWVKPVLRAYVPVSQWPRELVRA